MVVWAVTIPLFLLVTLHNARAGRFAGSKIVRVADEYRGVVLTAWFLVVGGLIAKRFWDYWQTLLP
jgi:hypothetical protein